MTTQIIKNRFECFLESLLERIERISDYFICKKHISLSEGSLFAFALFRATWFACFGVENANYDHVFGAFFWVCAFVALSAAHFAAFFLKNLKFRAFVVCAYALIWSFLMFIAAYSRTNAPAVPSFFVLTLLSIFIAVRLFREKTND